MKRLLLLLGLVFCLTLSFSTYSSAKEPTTGDLKKKIAQMEKELGTLKSSTKQLQNENAKLKKQVPSILDGKIYFNGVQGNTTSFAIIGSKTYVEVDKIIPMLTSYNEQQVKFDKTTKSLYLGVIPNKGAIGLTNLEEYKNSWIAVNKNDLSINKQKISKNLTNSHNNLDRLGDITYKIDGKYSSLKFLYGIVKSGNVGTVIVEGDGNELFNSGDIDYQEDAILADVNIKDVKFLTIKISNYTAVGNPTMTP